MYLTKNKSIFLFGDKKNNSMLMPLKGFLAFWLSTVGRGLRTNKKLLCKHLPSWNVLGGS